jgi:hypothetical protein
MSADRERPHQHDEQHHERIVEPESTSSIGRRRFLVSMVAIGLLDPRYLTRQVLHDIEHEPTP